MYIVVETVCNWSKIADDFVLTGMIDVRMRTNVRKRNWKKASFNCWNFISSFCSLCLFRRHELFILCHRKKCWMIDAKQLKLVKQLLRNIGLSALNWFHFESSVWSTVFFSLRLSFSSIRSSIQILNGNKYWFCSVTLEQFTLLVVYFRWRHSNNKRRQR